MDISELASIAEIVGGITVVISLIYLAIQVRENSVQTRLGSAISLNHLINEAFDPIYNNDRNIAIWTVGLRNPAELDPQDQAIFSLFMARLVNVFLTAFSHDQHKVLDTDVARRYAWSLKSILDTPGGKYWVEEMGGSDQLSTWALEVLAASTGKQDFLTHGVNRTRSVKGAD